MVKKIKGLFRRESLPVVEVEPCDFVGLRKDELLEEKENEEE